MNDTEIQVGEYVRFRDGNIRKVIKRNADNEIILDRLWRYGCGVTWVTKTEEKEDIINHDFNIIKLIEAGDYVNGYLVEAIDYYEDENGNLFDVLGVVLTDDDFAYSKELKNINIHSIVTKEQFKAMEYEVVEDD